MAQTSRHSPRRSYGTYDKDNDFGRGYGTNHVAGFTDDGESVSSDELQKGVRKIEAISQAWTKRAYAFAYLGYVSLHSCLRMFSHYHATV